ncbi:MAG: peptidase S51, partial [Clostridia bacterium]|nr:peptidase S51 [Clostridia bacterium]
NYIDMIQNADVLFFTGGMPEKAIAWMEKLGITDAVKNFDGTVMGASAGAMLQLESYHITPDEDYDTYSLWKGLGLVKGLDLEVHYLATDLQNSCTKRAIDDLKLPVYQMWHEGGLIVDGDSVKILGNVNKVE